MLPEFLSQTISPKLQNLGYKVHEKDCSYLLGDVNITKGNICISIHYNVHPHDYPGNEVTLSVKNIKKYFLFRPKNEEELFCETFEYNTDEKMEELLKNNIKRTLNIDI